MTDHLERFERDLQRYAADALGAAAMFVGLSHERMRLAGGLVVVGADSVAAERTQFDIATVVRRHLPIIACRDLARRRGPPDGFDFLNDFSALEFKSFEGYEEHPGWPANFASGPRVSGWPERSYHLSTGLQAGYLHGPFVGTGDRIFMTHAGLMRYCFGQEWRPLDSRASIRFVIPDRRIGLARILLEAGRIRVVVRGAPYPDLTVHCRVLTAQDELAVPMTGGEDGLFEGPLERLPSRVLVLLRLGGEEVVDWADFEPLNADLPNTITVAYSPSDLSSMIAQGEGPNLEFKRSIGSANRIDFLESVVAFSNSTGGRILIGVDNDGGVVGQVADNAATWCAEWSSSEIDPPVEVKIRAAMLEGRDVLVVEVPRGGNRPYMVRKTKDIFVRVGDRDVKPSRAQLHQMSTGPQAPGVV